MFDLKPHHFKKQHFNQIDSSERERNVSYSVAQIYNTVLQRAKFLVGEVEDIFIDQDGIWIYLSDKYKTSMDAHTIHVLSIKELREELKNITQSYRKQAQ